LAETARTDDQLTTRRVVAKAVFGTGALSSSDDRRFPKRGKSVTARAIDEHVGLLRAAAGAGNSAEQAARDHVDRLRLRPSLLGLDERAELAEQADSDLSSQDEICVSARHPYQEAASRTDTDPSRPSSMAGRRHHSGSEIYRPRSRPTISFMISVVPP
jgi:hypothetical protein